MHVRPPTHHLRRALGSLTVLALGVAGPALLVGAGTAAAAATPTVSVSPSCDTETGGFGLRVDGIAARISVPAGTAAAPFSVSVDGGFNPGSSGGTVAGDAPVDQLYSIADGDHAIVVTYDGATVLQDTITVDCAVDTPVATPAVSVLPGCNIPVGAFGLQVSGLSAKVSVPAGTPATPYEIKVNGGFNPGASGGTVSGDTPIDQTYSVPDGDYAVVVTVGGVVALDNTITVDCTSDHPPVSPTTSVLPGCNIPVGNGGLTVNGLQADITLPAGTPATPFSISVDGGFNPGSSGGTVSGDSPVSQTYGVADGTYAVLVTVGGVVTLDDTITVDCVTDTPIVVPTVRVVPSCTIPVGNGGLTVDGIKAALSVPAGTPAAPYSISVNGGFNPGSSGGTVSGAAPVAQTYGVADGDYAVVVTYAGRTVLSDTVTVDCVVDVAAPPTQQDALYMTAFGANLYAIVDGSPTVISYRQWKDDYNLQAPVQVAAQSFEKTTWSATIFALTTFPTTKIPVVEAISGPQWTSVGRPSPQVVPAITGSDLYQYSTSSELFIGAPNGEVHKLTFAEWRATGFADFQVADDSGFIKLAWNGNIGFATALSSAGVEGGPITYAEWASADFPTPRQMMRFAGDQFTQQCGSAVITYQGPTLFKDLTYTEWQAAGAPAPQRIGGC